MDIQNKTELDINNPDSIFLFGNDVQTKINGYTKTISNVILCGQGEIDYILLEMKRKMDSFEELLGEVPSIWKVFIIGKSNIKKSYAAILSNINNLELALKLQEAKLLKDIEVFKRIKPLMEDTESRLCSMLEQGRIKLAESASDEIEEQIWRNRLDKRLDDLEVSYTILKQTQKQVDMLMLNDSYLVDKILAILGTTIPIWRTQVALLLGVERTNEQLLVQNKIARITESYAKENATILKRRIRKTERKTKMNKDIDLGEIKKLNKHLLLEMDNLLISEKENNQIVADTKRIILKI